MAKLKGYVVVDTEKCKGCELCNEACPFDVLSMSDNVNGKGYRVSYMKEPDKCTGCASCAMVCPDAVLTIYRAKVEV